MSGSVAEIGGKIEAAVVRNGKVVASAVSHASPTLNAKHYVATRWVKSDYTVNAINKLVLLEDTGGTYEDRDSVAVDPSDWSDYINDPNYGYQATFTVNISDSYGSSYTINAVALRYNNDTYFEYVLSSPVTVNAGDAIQIQVTIYGSDQGGSCSGLSSGNSCSVSVSSTYLKDSVGFLVKGTANVNSTLECSDGSCVKFYNGGSEVSPSSISVSGTEYVDEAYGKLLVQVTFSSSVQIDEIKFNDANGGTAYVDVSFTNAEQFDQSVTHKITLTVNIGG